MAGKVEKVFFGRHLVRRLKDPNLANLKDIIHGNELFYLPPFESGVREKWLIVSCFSTVSNV